MIVQLGAIGLTETPEFVAGQNTQAEAANAGNSALADAIVAELARYGYKAHVEPGCGSWTWPGMVVPCRYFIVVEGLDNSYGPGGDDYLNRDAGELARGIISNATHVTPQEPSATAIPSASSRPTGTTTRPTPTAVARPTGVVISSTAAPKSTAAILTGDTTSQVKLPDVLQQIIPTGDVSGWISENKWLLIGGAAVVAFFVMGRGK